jgi:hypothetical protein
MPVEGKDRCFPDPEMVSADVASIVSELLT